MTTVIITGCSSGFGELTALAFARRGHTVFATMRDVTKRTTLETAAQAEHLDLTVLALDVDDSSSVASAIATVVAAGNGIDIVVNNAGIEFKGPLEHASDEEIRRQFETNVFGPIRVLREVLPTMRAQRSGSVVNVGSLAGRVARPYGGIYAASKHAVEALTESLYSELKPFGIRVHVVEPGQFATSLPDNQRDLAAFGPDSPYWDSSTRFEAALPTIAGHGDQADPQLVADVIVRVATDPDAPLRTLVGSDAELVMGVRETSDFETFEHTMRTALDWWD
jgi:NAD(P)-dependent dehydrogenase (short-subunit alcohol dehydrogenase family)